MVGVLKVDVKYQDYSGSEALYVVEGNVPTCWATIGYTMFD